MSTVEVSDVTPEMYAAVEARAASRSVTVEQYVLDLIRQDLDGAGMERSWASTPWARWRPCGRSAPTN